jgi:hypothetical protein
MSHEEPLARGGQPSVSDVGELVARAQRLVDSRPRGAYSLAWAIEASYIGDLAAIAAVAARAAGATGPKPTVR